MKPQYSLIGILLLALGSLLVAPMVPWRWDSTLDQRYSLSEVSKQSLDTLEQPIRIDIFLTGDLPPKYMRFRKELDELIDAFKQHKNIFIIQSIDPLQGQEAETVVAEMNNFGMPPERVVENETGNRKETLVFPWVMLSSGDRSAKVALLQNNLGATEEEKIIQALQQLEYQLMDGIFRLTQTEKSSIAVLTSHDSSPALKIADFLQSLRPYYQLAAFDLKAPEVGPEKALENLNRFKLLIIPNPKTPFSAAEKFILDQYTLQGGALLWLVEGMQVDHQALLESGTQTVAVPLDLNLDDYFFNQGIRVRKEMVRDLYCAPIVLAIGEENNTQYLPYPWPYYPLPKPNQQTFIGKDIGPIFTQYVSPLDTLAGASKKTVLLQTSAFTKMVGTPAILDLQSATQKIKPSEYNEAPKPLAVLVEGEMHSLFENRILPFEYATPKKIGTGRFIVIGDGSVIENQVNGGTPLALGYDKWSNNFYANRSFLMHCIHYLSGNTQQLSLRNKDFSFSLLDPFKIEEKGAFWKIFMVFFPILLGVLIGYLNFRIRSKHYRR